VACASEANADDVHGAGAEQGLLTSRERGAGGRHVVDQQNGFSADEARVFGRKCADHVGLSVVFAEARLLSGGAYAREGRGREGDVKLGCGETREQGGLVVATLDELARMKRDRDDEIGPSKRRRFT